VNITHAVKPVAPYVGGKVLLAKTIIERIKAIPHTCYAEPFVGMGGVFLRRLICAGEWISHNPSVVPMERCDVMLYRQ